MKILFIGGTGIISTECARAAANRGMEVTCITRGRSLRELPDRVEHLQGDIHDIESIRGLLSGRRFDAVVDWIAYVQSQVERDIELFSGITDQYVFISSASAYQTPPAALPVTESTPLYNPYWEYSRNKIACEERLMRARRESGFPVTIIRPSHTYDRTSIPVHGGFTVLKRIISRKPVIVHGDGTSLWTLTHSKDFADGFTGLLGLDAAIGQAVHITSDELLTWNAIVQLLAGPLETEPEIVHIPSEVINRYDPQWGASLLGDKAHSMIFDNSKIRSLVPGFKAQIPFSAGAPEIVRWFLASPARQTVNSGLDSLMDRMIEEQG
jgi:nucleoside-diphosphate-sugar epimerase